jgi:putative peptidoglycan lipid II flippase
MDPLVTSAKTTTTSGAVMRRVAVDSLLGAAGTLLSRVSGLARLVVVGAVLGPTFFANLYQSTNSLPSLVYELMVGSLLTSLVVPAVVVHFDRDGLATGARLASRFLTLAMTASLAVIALVIAAGQQVLGLLTAGAPGGPGSTGLLPAWLLLGLLAPQVPLYMLVGTAAAVQNARGRFALASAAPSVENVAVAATLVIYAATFGSGAPRGHGLSEVALLGGGTTTAVLLHAALQWWGAHRCGVRLTLSWAGWRDPEVRSILRLAVPSLGYAGLNIVRYSCFLVVVAAFPGAVVALSIAWSFYSLIVALAGRPIAQAALPHLSRAFHSGDDPGFSEALRRTLGLALFLSVPSAVAYAVLSGPLAAAVTFGQMDVTNGTQLVQYCLLGLSLGVIGQTLTEVATQAAYARRDARRPLQVLVLRTVVALVGMLIARALLEGPALMLAAGASVAVSDLVAGTALCWAVSRNLPRPVTPFLPAVYRTCAASLAVVPVALPIIAAVGPHGHLTSVGVVLLAGGGGAAAYVVAQWLLRSPEVGELAALVRHPRVRADAEPVALGHGDLP